jgi:hypothetical protein
MTCTDYIYRLANHLEERGVTVSLFCHYLPVAGRIDYLNRDIKINEPSALGALMTLAHEGGHWLSYLRFTDEDFNKESREELAYIYGWSLLQQIARGVVSRKKWREHHGRR